VAKPSSQAMAVKLIETLSEQNYVSSKNKLIEVIQDKFGQTEDIASEWAETELDYVVEYLREIALSDRQSGTTRFEIDEESPPYIRSIIQPIQFELRRSLQNIPSDEFENVCSQIVNHFGGTANVSGGSDDGGIDFSGFNITIHQDAVNVPLTSKIVLIGQAKRHRSNNVIKLNELKKFVGSCKARINELIRNGTIGSLTPVVCAFWTTSSFTIDATEYGNNLGLWCMDGLSIANCIERLDIELSQ
jgi:restriction endonuclease Mrr